MKIEQTHNLIPHHNNYALNIYISPSPNPVNWSSPRSLFFSILKNAFSSSHGRRKIMLGHVNLELISPTEHLPFGMHYQYKKEGISLLLKKSGLGLLFHNMLGRFNTTKDIAVARDDFRHGKTSVLSFIIDKDRFDMLKKYREQFLATGEQYNYGLNNNPLCGPSSCLNKETCMNNSINFGSGCSAFIISILEQAGIHDVAIFKKWDSSITIGESLIGPYSDQIYTKKVSFNNLHKPNKKLHNPVSLYQLIRKGGKWSHKDEATQTIHYYSPNLMYQWLISFVNNPNEDVFSGKLVKIFKHTKYPAYQVIINLNKNTK